MSVKVTAKEKTVPLHEVRNGKYFVFKSGDNKGELWKKLAMHLPQYNGIALHETVVVKMNSDDENSWNPLARVQHNLVQVLEEGDKIEIIIG